MNLTKSNMDVLSSYFPSDARAFSFSNERINNIKDNAIVVFDTNILLNLYVSLHKESLSSVRDLLIKLKQDRRLFLPARVAREFAKNRGNKIVDISRKIKEAANNLNNANFSFDFYPLLETNLDYIDARNSFHDLRSQRDKIKILLEKITDFIKDWDWQDPVSKLYSDIFTDDIIINIELKKEDVKSKHQERLDYNIAPGFKDEKKTDQGIGDFIIWLTLIKIGKDNNANIVFVSEDNTKGDWFHNDGKIAVYPKTELLEEFSKETNGKTIKIIDFNKFISLFKLDPNIITLKETIEESSRYEGISSSTNSIINENDKLCVGMFIELKEYGRGEIISITPREDDTKIVGIDFEEKGKIDLMMHLIKDIKIIDPENKSV